MLTRSVARNAALPTLTIAGVLFGELVGGAVVTETVFGRTGIGRLTEQAVANQDIPVLQGVVLLSALGFVLISLAVDLVTPLIDPRQRHVARATTAPRTAGGAGMTVPHPASTDPAPVASPEQDGGRLRGARPRSRRRASAASPRPLGSVPGDRRRGARGALGA